MALAAAPDLDATDIATRYAHDGYYFPLEVMSPSEAMGCRAELDSLQERIEREKLGNKGQLNFGHIIFPFADRIARHPRILDTVETILGPDILAWGSTFFIKDANSPSYVSWHQDLRYWGLDSEDQVSVWVALGPVTEAHGCMRFVPGSHKGEMLAHRDTFAGDNFLTRGQEAEAEIDENKTVMVELEPGQASLHHGKLLHASGPNKTDERRVGLVINYIAPHVRQIVAKEDYATLVRGEDRYGHFQHIPAPTSNFSDEGMAWHRRVRHAQNEALYDGTGVDET